MYLISLNCMLKNGYGGKFYMYFATIKNWEKKKQAYHKKKKLQKVKWK